jgi:hypothetical protein
MSLAPSFAQPAAPDLGTQRSAMAKLDWMVGAWEGQGWTLLPTGERVTFRQTEAIESRLSGGLLVIEGRGFSRPSPNAPEAMMFNAFAVVSYNYAAKAYAFRSYAMGHAATMEASVDENGVFVWSMKPPGRTIRYRIWRTPDGQWREVGEYSADAGKTWSHFFEMTLTKKP